MKPEVLHDETLRRYLLDDVTDAEREKIEERFLEDDSFFDEMLAFEDEIFYEYKQNRLSAKERAAFEEKFLSSPEDRERAAFADAFLKETAALVEEKTPVVERKFVEPSQPSFRQSVKAFFDSTFPALRFGLAAAAAVLLLVGVAALYLQNSRLQNEMADLQNKQNAEQARQEKIIAENERRRAALERELNEQRSSAEENEKRIREIEAERARLEREITDARRRLDSVPKNQTAPPRRENQPVQPPRSFVALVLSPLTRSTNAAASRARISDSVKNLRVSLQLKNPGDYKSLRATLRNIDDGAEIWSSRSWRASGRKNLDLNIPARILKRGDYEIVLFGTTADGETEEVTSYYFSVEK